MPTSETFRDFEHAGWGDDSIARSYHSGLAEVTRGCIPALLDAAGLKKGDRVLDIACGAGYVAAAARDRGADAVGIDFSAVQVRLAEQLYPGIRFVEGDAEALPFADAEFEVAFNAFGLLHVPDPNTAIAEAYRVLKPGGRFIYAAWTDPEKCIGFSMVLDAIRTHGTLEVGLPSGPNFFYCGNPDAAKEMLGKAGFREVSTKEVPLVWRVPSPDVFIRQIELGSVRTGAILNRQSPENLKRIKQYLRERIFAFEQKGTYEIPTPALVASCVRPHINN